MLMVFFSSTLSATEIYLAGGCFWCTEKSFETFPGVTSSVSGYCNGKKSTANYRDVSTGKTSHRECVKISYDKQAIELERLLENYIKSINPMDLEGQFSDRGSQYKIEMYFENDRQKKIYKNIIDQINNKNIYPQKINVPILPFISFFPAENYHQDYYKKNPLHYQQYEKLSGRKKFLQQYSERFNK